MSMEIVKGKRTKRSRPYSPTTYLFDEKSGSTQEDEDMANCLILLAQGFYPNQEQEEDDEDDEDDEEQNISRKKFINLGVTDSYIYECQTCNRIFTSFQALGGHRASHKKPRVNPKENKYIKREEVKGQLSNSPLPVTVHVADVKPVFSQFAIRASKVHECSICGSEFSSGQALGGHMRRHRTAPPQVKTVSQSEEESHDHKMINILSFDLNLPAPVEDDQNQVVESTFGFMPKNHLIFAGPALVNCHY